MPKESTQKRFHVFSFLDVLTGLVGVLIFMLLLHAVQMRTVENPLAVALLAGEASQHDVDGVFFVLARGGLATVLPEQICARSSDLRFGGGFDHVLEQKTALTRRRLREKGKRGAAATAIILIQDDKGVELARTLRHLLSGRPVTIAEHIIPHDRRTDRAWLLAEAERSGQTNAFHELELDLEALSLTNWPELCIRDADNMPHPIAEALGPGTRPAGNDGVSR